MTDETAAPPEPVAEPLAGAANRVFETSDNPVPEGAKAGAIVASLDGMRLRYALFPGQSRPLKGTVVILPGRNECIEKYFETIADLQKRGFGVAIMDWRGQGGSGRSLRDPTRGHVVDFEHYLADLEQFFEEVVLPDCRAPFFMLAHSTGGLVALMAAPAMVNRIRRMVLSAPLLEFTGLPLSPRIVERLAGILYALGFGGIFFGSGRRPKGGAPFEGNTLTSDPDRWRRNQAIYDDAPALSLSGPTVSWVRASLLAARKVREPGFMARIQIPVLMVAAGADEVVSTRAIETYAKSLRSGSAVVVDGARHELLQERDRYREQFLAAFDAFVPGEDL